jgi:hypothetical protein
MFMPKKDELDKIFDAKWKKEMEKVIHNLPPDIVETEDWIPNSIIDKFYVAQDKVRSRYSENKSIIKLMDIYQNWKEEIESNPGNFTIPGEIPSDLLQEFATLCEIRRITRLGKKEGLRLLLGETSEKAINDKFISKKQSSIASHDRPDALTKILLDILRKGPSDLSYTNILLKLKHMAIPGQGPILEVTREIVEWMDENEAVHEVPIPALKNRISRAKNTLKK